MYIKTVVLDSLERSAEAKPDRLLTGHRHCRVATQLLNMVVIVAQTRLYLTFV